MSNYYAPCFYRIDFVVIPSFVELPWLYDDVISSGEFQNGKFLVKLETNNVPSISWKALHYSYQIHNILTVEAAHNHRMTQSEVIAPAISNMPIFVKE